MKADARHLAIIAVLLALTPARAQETLLDYRDHGFLMGSPYYSQAEIRTLRETIEADAPQSVQDDFGQDFALMGDSEGRFSGEGAQERIYLVQRGAPVAIEPFPDEPPPALAVLGADRKARFYRLPDQIQYQRLVAAGDVDGDGLDEVLLEASSMNMGQSTTSVSVVKLGSDGGEAKLVGEPAEVYYDGCENPAGERERRASTVTLDGAGDLIVEPHAVPCD